MSECDITLVHQSSVHLVTDGVSRCRVTRVLDTQDYAGERERRL